MGELARGLEAGAAGHQSWVTALKNDIARSAWSDAFRGELRQSGVCLLRGRISSNTGERSMTTNNLSPEGSDSLAFREAVGGLVRGDFSRLEPLFDEQVCASIDQK